MKRNALILFVLVAVAILIIFGFIFYYPKQIKPTKPEPAISNFLIEGVPHYNFYQFYFSDLYASSTAGLSIVASIKNVLDYWGDDRFGMPELRKIFYSIEGTSFTSIKSFFEANGYSAEQIGSLNSKETIENIKKYVSAEKKTPILVLQRASLDPEVKTRVLRVLIGISDSNKKITVQDYYFGNNYEISYADFEQLSLSSRLAVLAVWPNHELTNDTRGYPDPSKIKSYPARPEAADKIGEILVSKFIPAAALFQSGDSEEAIKLYKEFVQDDSFQSFPSHFRVSFLSFLAQKYFYNGSYDETIALIANTIMPINHDLVLDKRAGWFQTQQERFASPYYFLAKCYLAKKDKAQAIAAYEEMKKIKVVPNRQEWFNSAVTQLGKDIAAVK